MSGELLRRIEAIYKGRRVLAISLKRGFLRRGREGEDLRGLYAPHAPFARANLAGVILDGAVLSGAHLEGANLSGASLKGADLRDCHFTGADLWKADLTEADLSGADLEKADLRLSYLDRANLRNANLLKADMAFASLVDANLREAGLIRANLDDVTFDGADLSDAALDEANMSRTSVEQTRLTGARVYGCATWGLVGTPVDQTDLIVTPAGSSPIRVDNLEVAQLVYLLMNNSKLRDVIDTVSSKGVLILGRFGDRKPLLDGLRDKLRYLGYVPIMLDSEPAESRDITETVRTLAGLSCFVIADISAPRSVPHELQSFVPFTAVPLIAIIQKGERPYALFSDFRKYDWVLPEPVEYRDVQQLQELVEGEIIQIAQDMVNRLAQRRRA